MNCYWTRTREIAEKMDRIWNLHHLNLSPKLTACVSLDSQQEEIITAFRFKSQLLKALWPCKGKEGIVFNPSNRNASWKWLVSCKGAQNFPGGGWCTLWSPWAVPPPEILCQFSLQLNHILPWGGWEIEDHVQEWSSRQGEETEVIHSVGNILSLITCLSLIRYKKKLDSFTWIRKGGWAIGQ